MHGSYTFLTDEMKTQEVSSIAPSTGQKDWKKPQKNKNCEPDSSKSPKRKNNILNDPAFLISNVMPPTFNLIYIETNRWHLNTLPKNSNLNLNQLNCISIQHHINFNLTQTGTKITISRTRPAISPIWELDFRFLKDLYSAFESLRPSVFDWHTDDSIPNFQSMNKKLSIMRHINYNLKPHYTIGLLRN